MLFSWISLTEWRPLIQSTPNWNRGCGWCSNYLQLHNYVKKTPTNDYTVNVIIETSSTPHILHLYHRLRVLVYAVKWVELVQSQSYGSPTKWEIALLEYVRTCHPYIYIIMQAQLHRFNSIIATKYTSKLVLRARPLRKGLVLLRTPTCVQDKILYWPIRFANCYMMSA